MRVSKEESGTGDPGPVVRLDEHENPGVWSGKAWSALLALEGCGRATSEGRRSRDVDGYLENLPGGCRGYPANRHARDESDDVRSTTRFYRARWFSVPVEVSRDGHAYTGRTSRSRRRA
ncbi:hypothetical protein FHX42_000719 [Saccharopolyspora lacisalsi]|uniref:Uncharacterized protein n=1 Tax=Halosaccharopolyspora lacisalsi TaxID=1000566 RepID=A0A839DQZ8_9PSEU|nr:hypothetical protein [Halosaccharopolyspora lacisalsi]MBA8823390.1 hypothetical protein [Halosaccharopolyspora lacisalsi]